MSLLEDTLLGILELRRLGKNNEEIASAMNINPEIIFNYERTILSGLRMGRKKLIRDLNIKDRIVDLYGDYYRTSQRNLWDIKKEQNIKKINKAISEGITNRQKISDVAGISINILKNYIKKGCIILPKTKICIDEVRDNDIELINNAIKDGAKTINQIYEKTGLPRRRISNYSRNGVIDLPSRKFTKGKIIDNKDLIDRLLFEEGKTLESVGEKVGLTKERLRQYVDETGQDERYKEAKKRRKTIFPNLIDVLAKGAIKKGYEEEIGEALRYYFKKGRQRKIYGEVTSLENLIELVRIYKKTKEEGTKLNYKELAELSGIKYSAQVGGILKEIGLDSFYWNCDIKKRISKDKKETIKRAGDLDYLSYKDLEYFLGVNAPTIANILRNEGLNRKTASTKYLIKRFGNIKKEGVEVLTYRDASQIYDFKDKFNSSSEEISEAIGKSLKLINYVLEHRSEIEPKLVYALQVLYPNEKIEKGYR